MVSIQMATAATGTDTYVGTPKSAMAEAMPANSESVTMVLETNSASMATAVRRTPNCSRMRDAKPLPVTHPMRAAVSCTTMSRKHMTGTVQSWPNPNCAPALEYVATPPASAPASAATRPGPNACSTRLRSSFLRSVGVVSLVPLALGSVMPAVSATCGFFSSSAISYTKIPVPWAMVAVATTNTTSAATIAKTESAKPEVSWFFSSRRRRNAR